MSWPRSSWRARLALSLASLLAFAGPGLARAQSAADVETARALFLEAGRRGHEGRWSEARELYARSLQLKQAPLTRYSLGVAQRASGRFADALASFRTFVSEPSTPASAPYVEPARAAIAALAARVGRVVITVEPDAIADLALMIDGQPAPPAWDGPRDVDPGAHQVVARAPNFRPSTVRFMVLAGGVETVTLALVPLTQFPGARPLVGSPIADAPPPVEEAPRRTVPIALMATGGGVFIAGVTLGLFGVSEANKASTRDGPDASAARTMATAGDIVAGAGLAAAAVGLVLLLTHHHAEPVAAGPVALWTHGATAGVAVRF